MCPGTRRNYAQYFGELLETVFADGAANPRQIRPADVVAFVSGASARYRSRTVESAATSLRSFFRFLRSEGLRADRLEDAVPMVPQRGTGLALRVRLERYQRLIASPFNRVGREPGIQ